MKDILTTLKSRIEDSLNVNRISLRLFGLLLLTDLAFIAFHFAHVLNENLGFLWSLYNDFGYSEIYQYIKEFWIVTLLLILAIRNKRLIYFSWALLFLYFLLDDSLKIHESLGSQFARILNLHSSFGLRAKDYGEVIVSLSSGTVLFTIIGLMYYNSDSRSRQISKNLFILIIGLVFFGVFVDMIHSWITVEAFGILEDGGEMVVMSMIVSYAFSLETEY